MIRALFKLTWVIGGTLLTACVSSPVVTSSPMSSGSQFAVSKNESICVLIPPDAVFEGESYLGSGDEIADQIKDELEVSGRSVRLIKESLSNAHFQCKEAGAQFAIRTSIVHYEDRVTGWSGKPDRIELKIYLYDLDHTDEMRSIHFEARSNMLVSAFFEWGNATPSGLLGEDFRHIIRKLLRQTASAG